MQCPFEKFLNVLEGLSIKSVSDVPSCPRKLDQYCLTNQNNCDLGKENNCEQTFKFSLNSNLYYINVRFHGDDKKGFIETTELSIKNLVSKEKESFKELLSSIKDK